MANAIEPRLEFYFDYASPFSYLADSRLGDLAKRTGASIVYKPILLGAVFKATGNVSPVTVPAKAAYSGHDLRRWTRRYGAPFASNPHFPMNTLRVMRGAVASQVAGCFAAYHRAVFSAMWEKGRHIAEEAVLREVLTGAGLDAASLLAGAETAEVKERLRAGTAEAVERGVFGVPSFWVGNELFWGNDRLDFVEEALSAATRNA